MTRLGTELGSLVPEGLLCFAGICKHLGCLWAFGSPSTTAKDLFKAEISLVLFKTSEQEFGRIQFGLSTRNPSHFEDHAESLWCLSDSL